MASDKLFVLPGDPIDPSLIPSHKSKALRLGPGLRHVPASSILPTKAGQLVSDGKKNSIWIDNAGGRYLPAVGDFVVGTVHHGAAEMYYVSLADHAPNATLPHLAFEGATRKTRPILAPGALVYARVALADRHLDAELECVSPATGKGDGLGPLAGGAVFQVSLGMARRLLLPRPADDGAVAVMAEMEAAGAAFETAVGRNGRVWVASDSARTVIALGRALVETDERRLDVEQQRRLVRKLIKDMS